MKVFFDSSAFAKRYVEEAGSEKVEQLGAKANEIALSLLSPVEVLSAMNRRRREKFLSLKDYQLVKRALGEDIRDVSIIHLSQLITQSAMDLVESFAVKTLDAIQIASAMHWEAELIVSADLKQLKVAEKSGLKIVKA